MDTIEHLIATSCELSTELTMAAMSYSRSLTKLLQHGENPIEYNRALSDTSNISDKMNDLIALIELMQEIGVNFDKLYDKEKIEKRKTKIRQYLKNKIATDLVILPKTPLNLQNENVSIEFSKLNQRVVEIEVSKITKHLESLLNIQNWFLNDSPIMTYTGWCISPSSAVKIIELLENNEYNQIIEFGCGTSTQLIVRTLDKLKNKKTIIPKITSFEHDKDFLQKTKSKFDSSVEYVLAPLKNITIDDRSFLYYDCKDKLIQINSSFNSNNSSFNSNNSILIIVDGPPGKTNNFARFPAMNYILDVFKNKTIHLFLDDFTRKDEQKIIEEWELILFEREIKVSKDFSLEGTGYCLLSFNV